ncbi:MAG TPA: sulfotransferase [Caulobacteraceae bacterium]|jgi:hypothetical protein
MGDPAYQGVVVLGFPRSGTTLLRRLLEPHPLLCCPPETHILRAAAAFLREDDFPLGYSLGVLTSLRFVGVEPEQVVERVRALVLDLLQTVCASSGKRIWVEKSAFDFFHLEAIERILGTRCRYIWISRHAADVVSSLKEYVAKVDVYPSELHEYVQRYPIPVEAFAHAWKDAQTRAAGFYERNASICLPVRYEDLVAAPEAGVQRILDFLDLPGDPAQLLRGLRESPGVVGFGDWKTYGRTSVTGASVGRSASLPPALLARIAEIVNPTLVRTGYEPIVVPPETLRTDPVRLLRKALAMSHSSAVRQAGASVDGE